MLLVGHAPKVTKYFMEVPRPAFARGRGAAHNQEMGVPARASTDDKALDEIRRVLAEKLEGTGAQVFLFGSRATGRSIGPSDVDVAVLPGSPLPEGLLSDIREALEESHIPYDVDVVDLSCADPSFRDRVMREAVRWTG